MSRIISRAESWEKAYEAFQNINFSAFDYDTIKESMVEYIKLYFPENFNDFIESSEFIAILELFAYLGELISYRLDINAHENFLSTAQRKESVLRLAKLISYNPSRNIPARGLVKLTSITTTETIFDSRGQNLANVRLQWNDINNPNWKEQFILVMNRIMQQEFGSVSPSDRVQVDDVLFELYELNNNEIIGNVINYSVLVSNTELSMELTPTSLDKNGPYENRPANGSSFNLLYGTDGLGDSSDTTGFFIFTKQGTLNTTLATFDGVTPNQTFEINVNDINETDVWISNIDPTTRITIDDGSTSLGVSGNWQQVDLAHAQNIIFNTNPSRNKYEIETLDNDKIRIIFGDGEFADIPSGTFQIWYRTSINDDIVIPRNTIVNKAANFTYQDGDSNVQTLAFTFSAINTFQNASASEDIEHIRATAPATYYTQDRMVNNRDYNTFFLQDPTILKLRAINRTFAGDSKYMAWHDGSESYENVKIFGDDLAIYFNLGDQVTNVNNEPRVNTVITNFIEPLLSSTDIFTILASRGFVGNIRKNFSTAEREEIDTALTDATVAPVQPAINLYYSISLDLWSTVQLGTATDWILLISILVTSSDSWVITHQTERLVAESQATKFWNTNDADTIIDYDTLNASRDQISILGANSDKSRNNLLAVNKQFDILGHENTDSGLPSAGLIDIHKLSVLPIDVNNDAIADDMELIDILNPTWTVTSSQSIDTPFLFLNNVGVLITGSDVEIVEDGSATYHFEYVNSSNLGTTVTANQPANRIVIDNMGTNASIILTVADYVYFKRATTFDGYLPQDNTLTHLQDYILDPVLWKRNRGRNQLNFLWQHMSPRFHLIDPAASNIIDMFIISKGQYTSLNKWLDDRTSLEPVPPTPLNLRTDYASMVDNSMISDTIVMQPGKFKILFGKHAQSSLQSTFKVVKSPTGLLTDNQIKVIIVDTIKAFFDINLWEFGETFYFTELSSVIHTALPSEIDTIVLVPKLASDQFGDLFQIFAREDEILQPSISVADVEIVQSLTSQTIRQEPS